jgi:hypothetical protein
MTTQQPDQQPEHTAEDVAWGRVQRKQEKIRAEIERNRAGGHRVPTWALAALLGAVVLAWMLLVVTTG